MSATAFLPEAGLRFTTSYHTQFPQYLRARFPIPLTGLLRGAAPVPRRGRALHGEHAIDARRTRARGFENLAHWQRGVDTEMFQPQTQGLPRPAAAHRRLRRARRDRKEHRCIPEHALGGSKIVIGDGPERARLQQQYPDATFTGYKFGEDLASHLAAADVMVFPSRTDTFGLVNLEAMACGVPVAAYPVTGPIDVIEDGVTGALDQDLARRRCARSRSIPPRAGRARCNRDGMCRAAQFENNLVPCRDCRGPIAPWLSRS